MPDIQAFRALRYDLGQVGSLSNVTAPPYDVISPDEQTQLYKKHPANCVRLILNRAEPGDDDANSMYTRAAKFFRDWQRQGVLFREAQPAVYVYHQEFNYGGEAYTRRGFVARVRLQRFGDGDVYPHEETMSGPKEDRLKLTNACKANLSAIFGLYPDETSAAQTILEKAIVGKTPLDATDHLGVVHRMWPVSDVAVISSLTAAMGGKPIFIADGHHRYETACNYRDRVAAGAKLDANHPANFVQMMCVGMSDPGTVVFPTHRLFKGLPAMTADDLRGKLGDCFDLLPAGEGPQAAHEAWETVVADGEQGTLAFYTAKDRRWSIARLSGAGEARLKAAAPDRSDDWRGLSVAILHRLVIDTLLKATNLPKPTYVHLIDEVVQELEAGDYPLTALVQPPGLDQIEAVSRHLERMPAKSTYFYPKLLSGLVFNPLE
jgi:uncharacterized protein (DUF1015 family)